MADIVKELSLNYHPKNYKNNSLYDAKNVKLSDDGSILENENILEENDIIKTFLDKYLKGNSYSYKIIHVIPCNNEFILFVQQQVDNVKTIVLLRYDEKDNKIAIVYGDCIEHSDDNYKYNGLSYNDGVYSGDFTYNVDSALIISFCEHSTINGVLSPMKTINLGVFTKGNVDSTGIWRDSSGIYNDRNLSQGFLDLMPEVNLPTLEDLGYVTGKAYCGWYYIFIRYKINKYDYTKWYNIGPKIPVTNKTLNNITNIPTSTVEGETSQAINYNGFYSPDLDVIGQSFKFKSVGIDTRYEKYQLGFIIVNNTFTKNLRTEDINIDDIDYIYDSSGLIEESLDITEYENYFDVKNIINKKNKLFISNYKTINHDIDKNIIKQVQVGLKESDDGIRRGFNFIGNDNLYFDGTIDQMGNLMSFLLDKGVDIKDLTENIIIRFFDNPWLETLDEDNQFSNITFLRKYHWIRTQGTPESVSSSSVNPEVPVTGDYCVQFNPIFDCYNNKLHAIVNNIQLSDTDSYRGGRSFDWQQGFEYYENMLFSRTSVNLYTTSINLISEGQKSWSYLGLNAAQGWYVFKGIGNQIETIIKQPGRSDITNVIKPYDDTDGFNARDVRNIALNNRVIRNVYNDLANESSVTSAVNRLKQLDKKYMTVKFYNANNKLLLTIYNANDAEEAQIVYARNGIDDTFVDSLTTPNATSYNKGQFTSRYLYYGFNPDDRNDGGSSTAYTFGKIWNSVNPGTYTDSDILPYIGNYDTYSAIHDKMLSSMLPGEVYDLYIHFIDKYGNATDGYKLNYNDNAKEYCKQNGGLFGIMPIYNSEQDGRSIEYSFINYVGNYKCYMSSSHWIQLGTNIDSRFSDTAVPSGATCYVYLYAKYDEKIFGENTMNYLNIGLLLKRIDIDEMYFVIPTNNMTYANFADSLIATSYYSAAHIKDLFSDSDISYEGEGGDIRNIKKTFNWDDISGYTPFDTSSGIGFIPYKNMKGDILFKVPFGNSFNTNVGLYVNIPQLPTGYISYFISCKKINSRIPLIGVGNQYGIFSNQVNVDRTLHPISFIVREYHKTLDIISSGSLNGTLYINNLYDGDAAIYTSVYKKSIGFGGDVLNNRLNKGTIFKLNDSKKEPNINEVNGVYIVKGIVVNKNIYCSDDEAIYRLGNIYTGTGEVFITQGLNGFYGADDALMYNKNGVSFMNGFPHKTEITLDDSNIYLNETRASDNHGYAMAYSIINRWSQHILDSRFIHYSLNIQYSNDILNQFGKILNDNDKKTEGHVSSYIMPINSIDTFNEKLPITDEMAPYFYQVYREDIYNKYTYDKTISISNIISDESRINRWRYFGIEDYKFITENKGNIVKLIDLGTWLFVHTEHSLFGFDTDNWMKTQDKNVNLLQQEIIDIQYKEFFSEKYGYGGLKYQENSIKGIFGYIWFDKDHNHFYRLDQNAFIDIGSDIQYWLNNKNINNVFFLNDVRNSRLLILIKYNYRNITNIKVLSYNYLINSWISFHTDYDYEKISFNTKERTYFIQDNIIKEYNVSKIKNKKPCEVSIIVNDRYDIYKFLEYIEYKFREFKSTKNQNEDYDDGFIYDLLKPYSGEILIIKNEDINDAEYDLKVETINKKDDFTKPYYKLGDWRFNCLRNININNENNINADDITRIYGNYFIFRFIFNETNLLNIETFSCKTSQSENI